MIQVTGKAGSLFDQWVRYCDQMRPYAQMFHQLSWKFNQSCSSFPVQFRNDEWFFKRMLVVKFYFLKQLLNIFWLCNQYSERLLLWFFSFEMSQMVHHFHSKCSFELYCLNILVISITLDSEVFFLM